MPPIRATCVRAWIHDSETHCCTTPAGVWCRACACMACMVVGDRTYVVLISDPASISRACMHASTDLAPCEFELHWTAVRKSPSSNYISAFRPASSGGHAHTPLAVLATIYTKRNHPHPPPPSSSLSSVELNYLHPPHDTTASSNDGSEVVSSM